MNYVQVSTGQRTSNTQTTCKTMIDYFGFFSDNQIILEGVETTTQSVSRNGITLFVQGLMTGGTLESILEKYIRTEILSVDNLEGSFSLVLIDAEKQTVLLYRNLVGAYYTFYAPTPTGFCFSSNLASVAKRSGIVCKPNEETLPAFFLYRIVPGFLTLFNGIFKLLPGELVSWKQGVLKRQQLLTIESVLESHRTNEQETIDRIENVLPKILSDWYSQNPQSAVLLSGGVDSMILQVHWNEIWKQNNQNQLPPSSAVVLNHPMTHEDFNYTMSAVDLLKTDHLNVNQEPLSVDLMRDVIRQTGLMPNHVQTFYFATLAEGMKKAGFNAGICGEGADGIFGNGEPDSILNAILWQKKLPVPFLRSLFATLISLIKPDAWIASILRLSNHIDDLSFPQHPQNKAASFTDFQRMIDVFGHDKMLAAMQFRRELLDVEAVPHSKNDPSDPNNLHRAQLIGFFGEGNETAATWTALFHGYGLEMYNPFQDSRMIRVASNICTDTRFVPGNPKQTLKQALARHVPENFMRRVKLGFGQPIFEWLAPGGGLRAAVEKIDDYPWLPQAIKQDILNQPPTWFLWSLLCYDIWHKEFVR